MVGFSSSGGKEQGLQALLELDPGAYLRRVPGRETFLWPPGVPRVIVKRSRGSAARDRWYERLRGRRARSPGRREHENLVALASDGIPVPRAIAWWESPGAGSLVVMELVPHEETLRQRLERTSGGASRSGERELLAELAGLVARLHGRGWYHRDLYLEHVLVVSGNGEPIADERSTSGTRVSERTPGERRVRRSLGASSPGGFGALVLIDVGRARREARPRRRWHVKDLAALLHSTPAHVGPRTRLRFLASYLDLRGVRDRAARRAWARAVARKARRLAAHEPRHVSSPSPERRSLASERAGELEVVGRDEAHAPSSPQHTRSTTGFPAAGLGGAHRGRGE